MLLVQLAQVNVLIPYVKWKILLFKKVDRYPEVLFNRHVLAFFDISDISTITL